MVSNLMVVLCGESQVTPVVNTGTLYSEAGQATATACPRDAVRR